ncbi:pyridoxamine 5'-phosphate oxidase [Nakamurella antarctica]|uniref:Pyridoxine/pyridoxamine 5'-phosphate oxidase n=1 Tax=Nakamurella antarctica TaxID=1902245 RepID=A0A3G8ZTA3_9ACTN|nr:pyridoxamine 5'-phosphate oxidase [Nakamurella antarctica]AZI57276.1 pyridoxamine 5'-phosphate oxidase [Nakamurella antarctica]
MSAPNDDGVDLARMRRSYAGAGLAEEDLAQDWLVQFQLWLSQAVAGGLTEPNAMVLATVDINGAPSARTVLCKGVDHTGVVFYTNYTSTKSADLRSNPAAAVTFPWIDLQRQVHFRGLVTKVDAATTAAYWRTRPRGSQLGAWASPQSTVLGSRRALDDLQTALEVRFGGGPDAVDAPAIPVPPHWGGWRLMPETVEFWQGRLSRMHDRLRYRLNGQNTDGTARWVIERLAP